MLIIERYFSNLFKTNLFDILIYYKINTLQDS